MSKDRDGYVLTGSTSEMERRKKIFEELINGGPFQGAQSRRDGCCETKNSRAQ